MQDIKSTENIPTPNTDETHEVLPEVIEKEESIKKKQKIFKIIVFSLVGLVGITIISLIILLVSRNYNNKNKEIFEKEEIPVVIEKKNITDDWNTYDGSEIKLTIMYPQDTKLIENKSYDGSIENLEIIYTPGNSENINAENLTEGFIYRVTPLALSRDSLDDIANVKRDSFYNECGEGVQISSTRSDVIYDLEAKTFDGKNCNGDFKVTYVRRFGIYYEITRIYRGDLGFIQQYKATTEEMTNSLTFYPEDVIEEEPYKTYGTQDYGILFKYPKELTENCCDVPAPPGISIAKMITLGIKQTNEKYGVIGLFSRANKSGKEQRTFEELVSEHKDTLISDYKIANNGKEPTVVEERITIGGKEAVKLKGISWKGNDLIYINNTSDRGEVKEYYIFSTINKIGNEFEDIVQNILDTVEFVDKR